MKQKNTNEQRRLYMHKNNNNNNNKFSNKNLKKNQEFKIDRTKSIHPLFILLSNGTKYVNI